jgi:hypothetical protein
MSLLAEFDAGRKSGAVAASGILELGGRTFVLPPMTIEDYGAWGDAGREAVKADMADPIAVLNTGLNELAAVMADSGEQINPATIKALADAAFAARSSNKGRGKAEPTADQISAWSLSLDGVRWLLHYRVNRLAQTAAGVAPVSREWVAEHVAPDTLRKVSADLARIDKPHAVHPNSATPA